jgi:hypothetical protein
MKAILPFFYNDCLAMFRALTWSGINMKEKLNKIKLNLERKFLAIS